VWTQTVQYVLNFSVLLSGATNQQTSDGLLDIWAAKYRRCNAASDCLVDVWRCRQMTEFFFFGASKWSATAASWTLCVCLNANNANVREVNTNIRLLLCCCFLTAQIHRKHINVLTLIQRHHQYSPHHEAYKRQFCISGSYLRKHEW